MLNPQRAITDGQNDHEHEHEHYHDDDHHQEDDEPIRDIHALTPPQPPPVNRGRRREAWETSSHRSSSMSTTSEGASSENFTTMSREFNALVLAGSAIETNESDHVMNNINGTSNTAHLARIGEDEIPEETNPLAIVPDHNPLDLGPGSRRVGSSVGQSDHVSSVQRVKKEEVESKISAWQNAKIAKINNKFKREDAVINGLQEVASRLGLLEHSVRHYGFNGDVNGVLLMADIVLYGSSQVEQGFPSLIVRAMTFGIPVITPDFPIIKEYVAEGAQVIFFQKDNPEGLSRAFSLFISNGKLSKFARTVASAGRLHAKNMLALDCVTRYARILENVLNFPSDALLPGPISQLQQVSWEWNLFRKEIDLGTGDILNMDEWGTSTSSRNSSVVDLLEEEFTKNITENENRSADQDTISELDWDVLHDIESSEEYERLEMEQLEERMDGTFASWDDIYRNARKSERFKFEANERDEGELERTGQPVCIYEIYSGSGAWPFLHHGSLYRGLALSSAARRLRSDDVDAVSRLHLLNYTHYRDILCEIGGMFSIANKVDNIHKRPWIGFQSWRAAGRKVSLSISAEKVLEETVQETEGDVMYFWAHLDMDGGFTRNNNDVLTFWSMCDILNGGHCRTAFVDAFRQMYGLPSHVEALPPMPEDGGCWSALHGWVMQTPSFLEFIMFSRMFVDSLDALNANSSKVNSCLLSSSELEKKHCYCRVLELLVNVWAYHSGRKMVYLDPLSGSLQEQHPIERRRGFMWMKYFNFTLLKSMDEDLAEAADDGDYPREKWLWPWTGEVHWKGIYEREREERYRQKMDKKRKMKEKMFDRLTKGYRQKTLGG